MIDLSLRANFSLQFVVIKSVNFLFEAMSFFSSSAASKFLLSAKGSLKCEDNRVPLVSQELFHALNAKCSVYSSATSQSLDHAGLILQSKTICTPHGAHHQSEIPHQRRNCL